MDGGKGKIKRKKNDHAVIKMRKKKDPVQFLDYNKCLIPPPQHKKKSEEEKAKKVYIWRAWSATMG